MPGWFSNLTCASRKHFFHPLRYLLGFFIVLDDAHADLAHAYRLAILPGLLQYVYRFIDLTLTDEKHNQVH